MIVYIATNRINNKVYIGQTVRGLAHRKQQHLSAAKNGSMMAFHCAIRKYLPDNFTWKVIYHTDNLQDLNAAEEYLIAEYDSRVKGYNVAFGGNNRQMPKQARQKISIRQNGVKNSFYGKTHNSETRRKISERSKGDRNPMFGKTGDKSPMWGMTGNKHHAYGKHLSSEHKEKLSKALKGDRNPFYGKSHSAEVRKRISEKARGRTHTNAARRKMSISRTGERNVRFDPMVYAFKHKDYGLAFCTKYAMHTEFSLNHSHLARLLNGTLKSTKGWSLASPEYLQNLRKGMGEIICAQ